MVSLSTWVRYVGNKLEYSLSLGWLKYNVGQINGRELSDVMWKNFFQGRITCCDLQKGPQMAPIISPDSFSTVLVRKIPIPTPTCFSNVFVRKIHIPTPTQLFVGDVVLIKDPEKTDKYMVRRLAAIEGYEMVSTEEKDEPFVLDKDQCWVLSDNSSLKPKEARDSRVFGPLPMSDIFGRVIYALRSTVDHGAVNNSEVAMNRDRSVIEVELDVEEMVKDPKI